MAPLNSKLEKAVGMRDIAKRCHVSKATVSRAMQGDPRVRPETAQRVLAVAAEMGYDPSQHLAARNLALRKYGHDFQLYHFAMVLGPKFHETVYFSHILEGVIEALVPVPCVFATSYIDDPEDEESLEWLRRVYQEAGMDGYITISPHYVLPPEITNDAMRKAVVVCTMEPVGDYAAVTTDDEQGTYLAVKHLLDIGHRHFLQFASSHYVQSQQPRRRKGMERALREYHLDPVTAIHHYPIPHKDWLTPGRLRDKLSATDNTITGAIPLSQYLRSHSEITALLGLNDTNALWAWYGLQQQGWHIPEELSILGFDDTDSMLAPDGRNLLSSIRLPLLEIGRKAGEMLYGIRTGQLPRDTRITLPTELVIRHSIQPPRHR